MPNYNKVVLVGHITRTPDVRTVGQDGSLTVGNSGIAVNRKYKEKEEVMFIDFNCFGKTAEYLGLYTQKGDPILIEGFLKMESWDQEGTKRIKHSISVEKLVLLSNNKNNNNANTETTQDNNTSDDIHY